MQKETFKVVSGNWMLCKNVYQKKDCNDLKMCEIIYLIENGANSAYNMLETL